MLTPNDFNGNNNEDIDTKYPEHIEVEINEYRQQLKTEIRKEAVYKERIDNYKYLATAYASGKTLLFFSLNPTLIFVSVWVIAMIPSVTDLDGFNLNFDRGLKVVNLQKPLGVILKAGGAAFLAYGVLQNYYGLKAITERTYTVIEGQIRQYEGSHESHDIPSTVGIIVSVLLALAAYAFVPKRK